jgi:hypothetical protein
MRQSADMLDELVELIVAACLPLDSVITLYN